MLFVCFNFKLASSRVTSFLATVEMGTVPERVVGACITVPRSSSSGASPIGVSFKDASFASHVLVCLQCFFFQVAIWALEALHHCCNMHASKRRRGARARPPGLAHARARPGAASRRHLGGSDEGSSLVAERCSVCELWRCIWQAAMRHCMCIPQRHRRSR